LQNTELFFFAKYSTNKWTDVDAEVLCLTQHTTQQVNSARAALHPCGTDRVTPPVSTPRLHASACVSHTASLTGGPRLSARTAPHRTRRCTVPLWLNRTTTTPSQPAKPTDYFPSPSHRPDSWPHLSSPTPAHLLPNGENTTPDFVVRPRHALFLMSFC
jgi:hypothetical protein